MFAIKPQEGDMPSVQVIDQHVVYENPEPQLRARHAYFPGAVRLPSRELVAMFLLGEAMNATNGNTYITRSTDSGRTWQLQGALLEKPPGHEHTVYTFKPTLLRNGMIVAVGYCFYRNDPDERLTNPETDGLRDGDNLVSFSKDKGHTWTKPHVIPRSWPEVVEVSGPCIELSDGTILFSGSLFPKWDGSHPSHNVGVMARSTDGGKAWKDDVVFYRHPEGRYTGAEPRLCEMQPGRVVCLFWTLDHVDGKNLPNHVVVSHDGGQTWGEAIDTGVLGQASNLTYLGDDKLLTVHCHREGDIGLYVRIVDFAKDQWKTVYEINLWEKAPSMQVGIYREMANNLRFGQASFLHMDDDEYLVFFWCIEDGQGKIRAIRVHVGV